MFDPESKVKFMLEGLANIILRPNMRGLLTEYQKMKIGKYEIPASAFGSLLDDEMYSQRRSVDSGEKAEEIQAMMDSLARKYDEAKASRTKGDGQKKKKVFPPTRFHKIETVRKKYGVRQFCFARVDTDNQFCFNGTIYHIPDDVEQYASKQTKDGDDLYDMDQILCAVMDDGGILFFDMNIEPLKNIL